MARHVEKQMLKPKKGPMGRMKMLRAGFPCWKAEREKIMEIDADCTQHWQTFMESKLGSHGEGPLVFLIDVENM